MSARHMFAHNLRRFRLITFDVTDTLLSFRRPPEVEYARAVQQLGYGTLKPTAAMAAEFRKQFRHLNRVAPNFGRDGVPQMTWETWWRRLIAEVLRSARPDLDDAAVRHVADHLIDLYETDECWQKTAGADDLLTSLRRLIDDRKQSKATSNGAGGPLSCGIISNFDPRLKWLIENVQLPAFDFVLASYEVGATKPSPQIFDLALRMLPPQRDEIRPAQALHVGNTLALDYRGAREAGWCSVLITNEPDGEKWRKKMAAATAAEREDGVGGVELKDAHVFESLDAFRQRLELSDEIDWD